MVLDHVGWLIAMALNHEGWSVAANSKTAIVLEQRGRESKTLKRSSSTVHSVQLKLKNPLF